MKRLALLSLIFVISCSSLLAQKTTIRKKTKGFEKKEGFVTWYWDEGEGKIWLEIERFDKEFLYVNALTAGVGSNDIGLDRNQLGDERVVYFDRRGPKVLLVQPNYGYRAITPNRSERRSVQDAFASSVLWGFTVEASEKGRVLVDATGFLLRDAHGVIDRLKERNEGTYTLDETRSAVYLPGTLNFPQNSEFEATLTFTGSDPGGEVRSVVPTPEAITVRQHHSFVQLPDEGYRPRVFDPRAGYYGIGYQDYSTPVSEPISKRYITRHRLRKKNPDAAMSEPVEPIVYYLDRGTPEPVRSALIEGAEWWNQAFEAAGYRDAFQVEILPEGAHPLDVRYNVINWVHRSTRGWSYGTSVTDPRTGEIIKGHVLLGSLRVRQDYLIAEGLLAPYENGIPEENDPMLEMALARIRQLSAHEVGHTLGLSHNFAASINNRASVMDYPHPKVTIDDQNNFDLSDAYDTGIGEWDKVAIRYGYSDFPEGTDLENELNGILQQAIGEGLLFISDADARPEGGAHPDAHLWDYGSDPVAQMSRILSVRAKALDQFSEANIRPGMPMATLEDVLVPIYLYHRYQLEGTVKLIGGLNYFYSLRGDGQPAPEPVPPGRQRAALDAMLETLEPERLRLPQKLVNLIPPRPLGYYETRELFNSHTDPAFDPLGAAETAANLTADLILNARRAARLVDFEARDSGYLGLGEMIDIVLDRTIRAERLDGYEGAIQRTVDYAVLYNLMELAADDAASSQVRAVSRLKLSELESWLEQRSGSVRETSQKAAYDYMAQLIRDFRSDPETMETVTPPLSPPPGSPIGGGVGTGVLQCNF
ncbi:MAG: zinc-dependent metalloprotease [Balneolaceae bacterium]|nr:zinc-dependent metalloprotease [Balneolaceae bacterium]